MNNDLNVSGLTYAVDGTEIITGFGHCFPEGTLTLILGRSGSGKTMLIELLSGLRQPSAGQIRYGSSSLWEGKASRSSRLHRPALLRMGTAFQHPEEQLFARTVAEEFAYSLKPYKLPGNQRELRIQKALAPLKGTGSTWKKRDPFSLSGGQKRRLTLALLRATMAEWLLLDEPTAGLDHEGVSLLCQDLEERKTAGMGTIIVTHDAESLLSIADQVIILNGGRAGWTGTPEEIYDHPHILERHGLALPSQLDTLRTLRSAGFAMPGTWPNARQTAEAIVRQIAGGTTSCVSKPAMRSTGDKAESLPEATTVVSDEPEGSSTRLRSLDPRAVWLAYMLVAPGILLQTHWAGWFASALVMLGFIRFSQVSFREWSKPAIGFLIFTCFVTFFSGLEWGAREGIHDSDHGPAWQIASSIHFLTGPAMETFFRFSRLVMIMLIGFVLLAGISHLRLKRSLEQGLQSLKRLRMPIDQFALTASLMIRFLPMLLDEWNRFSRIAAARGKFAVRSGRIPVSKLRMTAVPFLMSLLRLGEMLSLILIVRGVGQTGTMPTQAYVLRMNRYDAFFVGAAFLILGALIAIRWIPLRIL